jgi:hypothetical protein
VQKSCSELFIAGLLITGLYICIDTSDIYACTALFCPNLIITTFAVLHIVLSSIFVTQLCVVQSHCGDKWKVVYVRLPADWWWTNCLESLQ